MYGPHMVANSRYLIKKFVYVVSYLVKIECRNAMFMEDMSIFRIITHAQQVEVYKFKVNAGMTRILELETMIIIRRNWG